MDLDVKEVRILSFISLGIVHTARNARHRIQQG